MAGQALKKGSLKVVGMLQRRYITTLEIPIGDPTYPWVLDWLTRNESKLLASQGSKASSLIERALDKWKPPPPHVLSVNTTFIKRENGSSVVNMSFRPGMGKYYMRYQGAWIEVNRTRDTKMLDLKSGSPWETLQFRLLAMDRPKLSQMLEEAKNEALAKEVGKTVVYTSYGPEWRPFGQPRRKRTLASVILDGNISDRIYTDVQSFLSNGKWYYERGIPYRRGYLLYGPPGSGKTSFIQALAGELDYNVCVLNLAEMGLTDDRLAHLLSHAPPRSFLLLEDVDAAFSKSRDTKTPHG